MTQIQKGPEDLKLVTLNLVYYATGWITGKVDPVTGYLTGDGIAEFVVQDMQKIIDFRVNLTNLGYKNPASSDYFESGIGKLLQNGEADLAIEYLYLTSPRVKIASPLHPIIMDGLFALFIQPESSIVRNIYLDPLPPSIWVFWLVALFTISSGRILIRSQKNGSFEKLRNVIPKIFADSLFVTVTTASLKDHAEENILEIVSLCLLCISSNILSMSVYFIFSARLLAVILQPTYPIQKWEDLIDNGFTFYYPPSFSKFVTHHDRFSEMNTIKFESENGWVDSLNAIFTDKHARLDVGFSAAGGTQWQIRIRELSSKTQNNFCYLISSMEIQKSNFGFSNAFYVAKQSPLKNVLNRSILRIKESGLLRRYLNHPTLERVRCASSVKSSYDEDLGINDVSFAFIMLILLATFSHLIFGLEVVCYRLTNKVIRGLLR